MNTRLYGLVWGAKPLHMCIYIMHIVKNKSYVCVTRAQCSYVYAKLSIPGVCKGLVSQNVIQSYFLFPPFPPSLPSLPLLPPSLPSLPSLSLPSIPSVPLPFLPRFPPLCSIVTSITLSPLPPLPAAGLSTLDIRTRLRISEAELAIVQREVADLLAEKDTLETNARVFEESWKFAIQVSIISIHVDMHISCT